MPFIAHVGVALSNDFTAYEKNKWFFIKNTNQLKFYWRLSEDHVYEVACLLFNDKHKALTAAKYIYCAVLYNLLRKGISIKESGCESYAKQLYCAELDGDRKDYPESSFFWDPHHIGGGLGPDVYEIPGTLEDFDRIYNARNIGISWAVQTTNSVLDFDNYDTAPFCYSQTAQPLLNTVVQADSAMDIGLQMTLYCGLLEHLAENGNKDADVVSEIDVLIQHVNDSSLSKEKTESLVSYLERGKERSSRQKCLGLCSKYAKERYGCHPVKKIIDDAYSIRSAYSHGEDCSNRYSGPAPYIKLVVLDVLKGYMNDKEASHA